MSQDKFPTSLPAIQRLVQRVQVAEQSQQKDIRLSLVEARALISELAVFSGQLGKAISDINTNLKTISDSTSHIEVKFDGGGFDKG